MKRTPLILLAVVTLTIVKTADPTCAQSIYTPYAFANFVGAPGGPGIADGNGRAARFRSPSAATVDAAGNVYVVDQFNFTIRKITTSGVFTALELGSQGNSSRKITRSEVTGRCGKMIEGPSKAPRRPPCQ